MKNLQVTLKELNERLERVNSCIEELKNMKPSTDDIYEQINVKFQLESMEEAKLNLENKINTLIEANN